MNQILKGKYSIFPIQLIILKLYTPVNNIYRPETLKGLPSNDSNEIENDPESEYPKNIIFI